VPAGKFILGSDTGTKTTRKPAHEIYLDAFYIGKYPVTNIEYKRFMEDRGQPFDIPLEREMHPVVNVNWHDARQYAIWAGMRLLTEAEWEKAASWDILGKSGSVGGYKRLYPWGDEFNQGFCNTAESNYKTTTPVDKYSPQGDSAYGCADMAGNVWEWTSSLKKSYPYIPDDGREDLTSTASHILRGGSWFRNKDYALCVYRLSNFPINRAANYGFRIGMSQLMFRPHTIPNQ